MKKKNTSSKETPFPLAKPKISTYVHHLYPFICASSIMLLQLHSFFLIVPKSFAWSILSFNVKIFISNIEITYDSSLSHCLSLIATRLLEKCTVFSAKFMQLKLCFHYHSKNDLKTIIVTSSFLF